MFRVTPGYLLARARGQFSTPKPFFCKKKGPAITYPLIRTPFSRATNGLKRTRRLLFPYRTQD